MFVMLCEVVLTVEMICCKAETRDLALTVSIDPVANQRISTYRSWLA